MSVEKHRARALELLTQVSGAVGSSDWDDSTVEIHRLALGVQALVCAQLAVLDLVTEQPGDVAGAKVADPGAFTPEQLAPYVPQPRVLYRDRDGDLWTCDSVGVPFLLNGHEERRQGAVWADDVYSDLRAVEDRHGPLHIAPWPGEAR